MKAPARYYGFPPCRTTARAGGLPHAHVIGRAGLVGGHASGYTHVA